MERKFSVMEKRNRNEGIKNNGRWRRKGSGPSYVILLFCPACW
jgi:hypothetical protein